MANVSSNEVQTAYNLCNEEGTFIEVKGEDGRTITGRSGQPVFGFRRGDFVSYHDGLPNYLPPSTDCRASMPEAPRSVSLAAPFLGSTCIPTVAVEHGLSINQHALLSQDQPGCFLNTQYIENQRFSMEGPQGVFYGRQVIAQSEPVVLNMGGMVGSLPYMQHSASVVRAVHAGQAILPVNDISQKPVPFYDVAGGVIPAIYNSLSPCAAFNQRSSGIYQNSASGSTVRSMAVKPVLAAKGGASLSFQEPGASIVGGREVSRRISSDDSVRKVRKNKRRARKKVQAGEGAATNPSARQQPAIAGSELGSGKRTKPIKKLPIVTEVAGAHYPVLPNSSDTQKQAEGVVPIKDANELSLSSLHGIKKKRRLLLGSMNDPALFVKHVVDVLKLIEENAAKYVWFSLKESEFQLFIDVRARLYKWTRGCPKDERKVDLQQAEYIFRKLDPFIVRAFEGFLDKINEGYSKLLFDTLDFLLMDYVFGIDLEKIDLSKLLPFINNISLVMSAGLACKIAGHRKITGRNKQALVVEMYKSFIKRLGDGGCINLRKEQVSHCFFQFSRAFINLPDSWFHESKLADVRVSRIGKDGNCSKSLGIAIMQAA
ncbi:hypothetical protein [Endozoicomonas atrinae]|uniref:hypothetical protein n=1 Tax=Endozoicomonas atrinae TaxID=1333660 RepID=UPI003AFF96D8